MLFFTAPVEKEREASCLGSPLLLQLLVENTENGFLPPGHRVDGWEMFERGTKWVVGIFSMCGFQHVLLQRRKDDNITEGKETAQIQCSVFAGLEASQVIQTSIGEI